MATAKKAPTKKSPAKKGAPAKRWSQHVTETSDAMDLKPDVFKTGDATEIARSVKNSAEHSNRRKSEPFRSAMSMLNFYINRAGHNLKPAQHRTLEKAKDVLRELYGRDDGPTTKKVGAKKVGAKKAAASKNATAKKAATKKAPTKKVAKKVAKKAAAKKTAARKRAAP